MFVLEYHGGATAGFTGLWGPFPTRSEADAFGLMLSAQEATGRGATWSTRSIRGPEI